MLFWSSLPPIFFSRARDRNFSLPLSSHAAPHPRLITRAKEEKTRAGRRVVPTVLLEQVAARHIFPPSNHLVAKNARIEPEQLTTRTSCFGFVVQIIQIIIEQIIIQQTKHASRFRYGPRSCRCGAVVGSRAPFLAAFCRYIMPKNVPARTTPKNDCARGAIMGDFNGAVAGPGDLTTVRLKRRRETRGGDTLLLRRL